MTPQTTDLVAVLHEFSQVEQSLCDFSNVLRRQC